MVSEDQTDIANGEWTQTFGHGGYVVAATSGNRVSGMSDVAEIGNFGNFHNVDISGWKWEDTDGDGEWDAVESGYDGWIILLGVDEDGDGIADRRERRTMTNGGGHYRFENLGPLAPGETYVVSEDQTDIANGEWTQTFGHDGYVVAATSGNRVSGMSDVAEIGNFGNFHNVDISGWKWEDTDGDGEWDAVESGYDGWRITV